MRLEGSHSLARVVVVHPQVEVIATTNEPVLAGDESDTSDRDLSNLKGFHESPGFVIPDEHIAGVETRTSIANPSAVQPSVNVSMPFACSYRARTGPMEAKDGSLSPSLCYSEREACAVDSVSYHYNCRVKNR